MTDTPLRKTLSLKRKKSIESISRAESAASKNECNYKQDNNPQKLKRQLQGQQVSISTSKEKQDSAVDYVAILAKSDTTLQNLQNRRKNLLEKIKVLDQRLVFISSEPLQTACNELKKEDTAILCQINDYLISNA